MSDGRFPLTEVIAQLRAELTKARNESLKTKDLSGDQSVRFVVEEATIELQVGITKEAGINGGVSFWFYTAGAEAKAAQEQTQKITIKLTPRNAQGEKLETSDYVPRPE